MPCISYPSAAHLGGHKVKFNICLGNLYEPRAAPPDLFVSMAAMSDATRYVRCALEELGHHVNVQPSFVDKDAINIFWDRFRNLDHNNDPPRHLKRLGYRFGLIVTEPLHWDDDVSREFRNRFERTAPYADFVWYLIEDAGPVCKAVNPNAAHLKFGYTPRYPTLLAPERRRPVVDLITQGEITERRTRIAAAIQQRGFTVSVNWFNPDYVRDSILEASRALLSIQKFDHFNMFSITTVYHAVMNKVPLIVEYSGPESYLSKYCVCASTERFVDTCCGVMSNKPMELAEQMHERLKQDLPAAPFMEDLIRTTCA